MRVFKSLYTDVFVPPRNPSEIQEYEFPAMLPISHYFGQCGGSTVIRQLVNMPYDDRYFIVICMEEGLSDSHMAVFFHAAHRDFAAGIFFCAIPWEAFLGDNLFRVPMIIDSYIQEEVVKRNRKIWRNTKKLNKMVRVVKKQKNMKNIVSFCFR